MQTATANHRLRHDPRDVLTCAASVQELHRTLRIARTIVNMLADAGPPAIAYSPPSVPLTAPAP